MSNRVRIAQLLIKIAKTTSIEDFEPILAAIDWSLKDIEEDLVEWKPGEMDQEVAKEQENGCPLEALLKEIQLNPMLKKDPKQSDRIIKELTDAIRKKKEKSTKLQAA